MRVSRLIALNGKKLQTRDVLLLLLFLSLPSLFWRWGRITLNTGNLVPITLIFALLSFPYLLYAHIRSKETFVFPRVVVVFLAVLATYMFADLFHGTLFTKANHYAKFLSLIVWALVIANLIDRRNTRTAYIAFILSGGVVLIRGFYDLLLRLMTMHPPFYLTIFDVGLRGRNASAHALLIWNLVLLGYVARGAPLFTRPIDLGLLVFFSTGLFATGSRGAALVYLFAVLLCITLMMLHRPRIATAWKRALLITLVVVMAFLAGTHLSPTASGRLTLTALLAKRSLYEEAPATPNRIKPTAEATSNGTKPAVKTPVTVLTKPSPWRPKYVSNATRLSLAKIGLRMIVDQPLGFGLSAFPHYYKRYIRPGDDLPETVETIYSPHIQYLDVAVQGGVIGLLLFLAFLWPFVRFSWSSLKDFGHSPPHHISMALVWVTHLVYFMFAWPLERMMFWTVVGFTLALMYQRKT